jgi:hypothetical protein
MADSIKPEFIPNPDLLFCRVHRNHFNPKENRVQSVIFKQVNQSVDWSKHATPEQTVGRHADPQVIRGVASITAGACRSLDQEVVHAPLADGEPGGPNIAHSEIQGEKSLEIKCRLRDAIVSFWENPSFRQSE